MLDPYKLILVNSTAFICFLIIIFLCRKRKNFFYIFLSLASFLPIISLLRKGVHQSGDFAVNIYKTIDLYNSLTFGIFPVHWAALLNATYGYPLFLFTYPLPYYSIALFKFLGFSFIAGEKVVIAIVYVLSGIGMYKLLKTLSKSIHALLGSIFYLYAPYHLVDMHYRIALGETFAFAFLPFIFYYIVKLSQKLSKTYFLFLIIFLSLLILSHQAISLITIPFIFLTPLFLKTKRQNLVKVYVAFILSLLITAFYWLPVIEGIKYTLQQNYSKSIGFENSALYFISPWRFGFLFQGPIGQLSFPIGFVQLFMTIFGIYLLIKKKLNKKYSKLIIYLYTILGFLMFLLLPISEFIWKILPFMTNFQFAYRLMLPISFVIAIICTIASTNIKKESIIYLLIILAMVTTILNWGTRAMITDINDSNLKIRTPFSTAEGEGLQPAAPKWRNINNLWMKTPPDLPLEIESGKAVITNLKRTPVEHKYLITVFKNTSFVENTYYFPGWNLYINEKLHKFTFIDDMKSNIIRFNLKPGTYTVNLVFQQTPIVQLSNILSIFGLALTFIYLLVENPQRRR